MTSVIINLGDLTASNGEAQTVFQAPKATKTP